MSDRGSARPVVIVSNRGPISFSLDEQGRPQPRRGAGGLVSGLAPLVAGTDTLWIAAAMSDGDRPWPATGPTSADGFRVHLLALDPDAYRVAYDVVGNETLWFLHHGLFDLARRPRFDTRFAAAWDAYRDVNRAFADAVAERRARGRGGAGAGLPPRARRPDAARAPSRSAHGALHPHPVRRAGPAAGAARRGRDRAARGHGRLRRLRVPHPALGRRVRGVLPRGPRRRAARPSSRRWPPIPTTSGPSPTDRRARPRWPSSTRWWATARCSCGSTASSCRRTCCAASSPSTTCSSAIRSGGGGSCSARSSTRRARGCPSTSPTARRSSR